MAGTWIAIVLTAAGLALGAGESLVSNGDFRAGLKGWLNWSRPGASAFAEDSDTAARGRRLVLRVTSLHKGAQAVVRSDHFPVRAGTTLEMSFRWRYVSEMPGDKSQGLLSIGHFLLDDEGRDLYRQTVSQAWLHVPLAAGPWQESCRVFSVPGQIRRRGKLALKISMGTWGAKGGPVGRVMVEDLHVRDISDRAMPVIEYKDRKGDVQKFPCVHGAPRFGPLALPSIGYVLYRDGEPGTFEGRKSGRHPFTAPRRDERIRVLATFAAQGARAVWWFKVFSAKPLVNPRIRVSNLRGPAGLVEARMLRLRRVRWWPQRNGVSAKTYRLMPELLEPLDAKAGPTETAWSVRPTEYDWKALQWIRKDRAVIPRLEPTAFWAEMDVPEGQAPGSYRGELTFEAEGCAPTTLPFRLRVLPFKLEEPDWMQKRWCLMGTRALWRKGAVSDAEIEREIALMRRIGFHEFRPWLAMADYRAEVKDGRLVRIHTPLLDRALAAYKRCGARGPIVIDRMRFERKFVALPLGLKNWRTITPDQWTPQVREGVATLLRQLDAKLREAGLPWVFKPVDEPQNRAVYDYGRKVFPLLKQLAPEVRLTTSTTFEYAKKYLLKSMDYPLFYGGGSSAQRDAAKSAAAKPFGGRWETGCIGAYPNLSGRVTSNRYRGGLLFCKSQASGMWVWDLQDWASEAYNDFDGQQQDFHLLYPPDDVMTTDEIGISTLKWEGVRLGMEDARYVSTFLATVARLKQPNVRAECAKAQAAWQALFKDLPWGGTWDAEELHAAALQDYRWWLGQHTARLVRFSQAGKAATTATPVSPAQPAVRMERDFTQESALGAMDKEALTVPLVTRSPVLDGKPDAPWKTVPEVELKDVSGGPAKARTAVRLLHDGRWLYLYVRCDEPHVKRILRKFSEPTWKIYQDDSVEVFVDPAHNWLGYFQIMMNANGAVYAYYYPTGLRGEKPRPMDIGAQAAGHVGTDFWAVEARFDMRKLEHAGRSDLWGITVGRSRRVFDRNQYMTLKPYSFHNPKSFAVAYLPRSAAAPRLKAARFPTDFGWGENKVTLEFARPTRDFPVKIDAVSPQGKRESRAVGTARGDAVGVAFRLEGEGRHDLVVRGGKGDALVFRLSPVLPPLAKPLQLQRRCFVAGGPPLSVVVSVRGGGKFLKALTARVQVRHAAARWRWDLKLPGPASRIVMPLDQAPAGSYRLTASLLRDGREISQIRDVAFEVLPAP